MFDLSSVPIPGGVILAGVIWVLIAGFGLGPVVADRTIENSPWQMTCEAKLRSSVSAQKPDAPSGPNIACSNVMRVFGHGSDQLCKQGGDLIFDLLKIDPLAASKEQVRRQEAARLARVADLAPSRCSCAASVVGADRLMWGLYAGSARVIGGPKNLQSELTQALHSPACARIGESEQ